MLYEPRRPLLIETGALSYLNDALKSAHVFKTEYINTAINIVVFVVFILITGGFLAYSYRGTPTPEEVAEKNNIKKQYVMEKISECNQYRQQQTYTHDMGLFDDTPRGWNDLL